MTSPIKENRARAKQLDKDIRGKFGKGATKVTGKYTEKDDKTGKETRVKERSHVVTSGKMGKRKFKKEVKKLGKKYGQDSVVDTNQKGLLHLNVVEKEDFQKEILNLVNLNHKEKILKVKLKSKERPYL